MGHDLRERSRKSLPQKLGIRERSRIAVLNAPAAHYQMLAELREVVAERTLMGHPLDLVHFFASDRKQLEEEFPRLKKHLAQGGKLWISWPKRASGVKTDLSDGVVREIGLKNGLVDVKVAAIDRTWSGLQFVRRAHDGT